MKILFLPNWKVHFLKKDTDDLQPPDKFLYNNSYWFFRYFKKNIDLDIIDKTSPKFISFLERKVFNFYIYQAIKAFRIRNKYDIIISHNAQSAVMFSFLSKLFDKRKKYKHIIVDIGCLNGARDNYFELFLLKRFLSKDLYIIIHSSIQIKYYKKYFPHLVNRVFFLPFGVDINFFKPLNLPSENYILTFGFIKRDYPTLIKAWQAISHSNVKLRIIGTKNLQIPLGANNIELIEKLDIQELKKQIAKSLFVIIPLPYYKYSYGQMSFLQSMSMGKTVILSKTPSSIDYVVHNCGAILTEPYNHEQLRELIIKLLNNREIITENNSLARKYIIKKYSEEKMGRNFEKIIYSIYNY